MLGDLDMSPSQALFYIAHNDDNNYNYNNSMGAASANDSNASVCVFVNCGLLVADSDQSMATALGGPTTMITLSMAMSLALCKVQ